MNDNENENERKQSSIEVERSLSNSVMKKDTVYKDLDFLQREEVIKLGINEKELFLQQLKIDVDFLQSIKVY